MSSLFSAAEQRRFAMTIDRVVELKEQLEVEEENGDRQEEQVEVDREKRVKESAPCG